jgi:hypothetical protein
LIPFRAVAYQSTHRRGGGSSRTDCLATRLIQMADDILSKYLFH